MFSGFYRYRFDKISAAVEHDQILNTRWDNFFKINNIRLLISEYELLNSKLPFGHFMWKINVPLAKVGQNIAGVTILVFTK